MNKYDKTGEISQAEIEKIREYKKPANPFVKAYCIGALVLTGLVAGAGIIRAVDRPVINNYISTLATAQELYSQGDVAEAQKVARGLQSDLVGFDKDFSRDYINSTDRTAKISKSLKTILGK